MPQIPIDFVLFALTLAGVAFLAASGLTLRRLAAGSAEPGAGGSSLSA